eukprot:2587365-Prymnesium_polylepis.1
MTKGEAMAWHESLWNSDYLMQNGCKRVDGPWLQCIHHPGSAGDDGPEPEWWELMAVCLPSSSSVCTLANTRV